MATIYDYVQSQPTSSLHALYSNAPWSALAVFQSLDKLSQQIVMRLLGLRVRIMMSLLEAWMKPAEGCLAQLRSSVATVRLP